MINISDTYDVKVFEKYRNCQTSLFSDYFFIFCQNMIRNVKYHFTERKKTPKFLN